MVSCLMGDSTALASAIVRCCHNTILNEVISPLLLFENVHFAFKILHFAT